jgi:hypothetical protein
MGRGKKPVITIDCETDPFKRGRVPVPFLWGMYDGERYRRFDTAGDLLRYLMTQKAVVYAHNGGKFDYQFLLDYLEPWSEVLIINGRLAKFTIGDCEFRDSWNILPAKLASFGQKKEIDIAKLEADVRDKHMAEIERYNAQDCRGLWEAVVAFRAEYGTGLTLAGSALQYWSKKFKHEIPETNARFYQQVSPYYYGGRVQCFHKGPINRAFEVVDINSAYPFAMTHNHPISTVPEEVIPKQRDAIVPQSLYTIEGACRGALPWRNDKGALLFPNDRTVREFHITGWELQAALDTKRLGPWKVIRRLDFLKEVNFTDYVEHFYQMKARAEKGSKEYTFAKLFMNSLYGKFGANPDEYRSYGLVPLEDKDGAEADPSLTLGRQSGPWRWAGMLGRHALMVGEDPVATVTEDEDGKKRRQHVGNPVQSKFYNVATAASITGFVRAFLLRHIDKVEKSGGGVLYCDTDSIVCTDVDVPKTFALSNKLGDWAHEGRFDRGAIAGKKLYAFHGEDGKWKTATKGVRLKPEEICRVADGEEVTWESDMHQFDLHRKLMPDGTVPPPRFLSRRVRMT